MLFDVAPQPGNIPAYAGRTQERSLNAPYRQKHPRIRGENHRDLRRGRFFLETSPHTRGEPSAAVSVLDRPGNIPAYAGRTIYGEDVNLDAEKHPRIRGENHLARLQVRNHAETSPHTRGELVAQRILHDCARNIPAYAGRTIGVKDSEVSYQKHPRIRGENEGFRNIRGKIKETSPHTRGELKQKNTRARPTRNIPAYAGRTRLILHVAVYAWKHPRIRGENSGAATRFGLYSETSPHTRGELSHPEPQVLIDGNIPAYAGRTWFRVRCAVATRKHPRIRGENSNILNH